MAKILQRQAMITTVKQLRKLADSLEREEKRFAKSLGITPTHQRHLVAIINKSVASDTWEIEK